MQDTTIKITIDTRDALKAVAELKAALASLTPTATVELTSDALKSRAEETSKAATRANEAFDKLADFARKTPDSLADFTAAFDKMADAATNEFDRLHKVPPAFGELGTPELWELAKEMLELEAQLSDAMHGENAREVAILRRKDMILTSRIVTAVKNLARDGK